MKPIWKLKLNRKKLYDVLVILFVSSFQNYLSEVYFETLLRYSQAHAYIHTHLRKVAKRKEYVMSDIDIEQSWTKFMENVKLQKHPKKDIDLNSHLKFMIYFSEQNFWVRLDLMIYIIENNWTLHFLSILIPIYHSYFRSSFS